MEQICHHLIQTVSVSQLPRQQVPRSCVALDEQIRFSVPCVALLVNPNRSFPSYLGNKYHALPWNKYVDIKLDASNLIDSNVRSALTDLNIYKPLSAMY